MYVLYINCIHSIESITPWCSKQTITKAVLEKQETRQRRVREALEGSSYKEADKVWLFFETSESLCLRENFSGEFEKSKLYKKLYSTAQIFSSVFDTSLLPDFSLKVKNQDILKAGLIDVEQALIMIKEKASK